MKLVVNSETGLAVVLSSVEQGLFMKHVHGTKFTTREVYQYVVDVWSANLEQDIIDAIKEMESEDGEI